MLFRSLKMKQEASGYPDWVQCSEDEDQFKQKYFQAEGITLDHVQLNPGKRAFAKTMLNCLWGKNAQNNVLRKNEYVNTLSQFYDIVTDPKKTVHYMDFFLTKITLCSSITRTKPIQWSPTCRPMLQ